MPRNLEDRSLTARDKLLRDSFTPAERFLAWTLCISAAAVFCIGQPRSYWILGFLLISGALTPVILKTHEATHPFFVGHLWRRFCLLTAPLWLLIIQYVVGSLNDPVRAIEIEGESYQSLSPINDWVPVTTSLADTWVFVLGFCCMYLLSINLFIIPKSRAFFEKLLPVLCSFAVGIGILGIVQYSVGSNRTIFTLGTAQLDFFSVFPYDGHWAAFALLWMSCCVSMAMLQLRFEDASAFHESTAPWYLTGACILGGSGLLLDAQWPAFTLLLTFGIFFIHLRLRFLAPEGTGASTQYLSDRCGTGCVCVMECDHACLQRGSSRQ